MTAPTDRRARVVDAKLAALLVQRRRELQALLGASFDAEVAALRPFIARYRDAHGCINGLHAALRMVDESEASGEADAPSVSMLLVVGATEVRGGGDPPEAAR